MIITWLCLLISLNIYSQSEAAGGTGTQKSGSFRSKLAAYNTRFKQFFRRSKKPVRKVLSWFRKNFKFQINCTRYGDDEIQCVTDGNLFNKIVFNRKFWVKLPNFIMKRIHFKPTKTPTTI